jgi:hypothetical protein
MLSIHLYDIVGIFILWIVLHYVASNIYPVLCCELSLVGLIKSIFMTQTPQCVALRWLIYNGGSVINSMWMTLGLWLSSKLVTACIVK